MVAIIIFILILSILVMIHEFGHFIMAKRAGIGVEEFGFGLPPRIWGKKIGETIYSVNWLPFGGFVRLVGEDPTDERKDSKNSFWVKSLRQRIFVVLAGVFMNFMLAVLVFYFVVVALGFKVSLPLFVEHDFKFVNQSKQVLIADVASGSPAQKAGIQIGESIVKIDEKKIGGVEDLKAAISASEGREVKAVLENPVNNKTREVSLTPEFSEERKAVIGVGLGELAVLNYDTFGQKVFSGFIHSVNTVDYSMRVFGRLIGISIANKDITAVSEGVAGPVGIASITSQAVSLGPLTLLQFMGLLSLNLAVMNVLPIPALDGGRLFFLLIEAVTRKRVNPKFEKWAHSVGFALLIGLILLITYNDILKLVK